MALAVVTQYALGVLTLLSHVDVVLAVAHIRRLPWRLLAAALATVPTPCAAPEGAACSS